MEHYQVMGRWCHGRRTVTQAADCPGPHHDPAPGGGDPTPRICDLEDADTAILVLRRVLQERASLHASALAMTACTGRWAPHCAELLGELCERAWGPHVEVRRAS